MKDITTIRVLEAIEDDGDLCNTFDNMQDEHEDQAPHYLVAYLKRRARKLDLLAREIEGYIDEDETEK